MIPHKVVVFGKGEAGKSTFIRTIIPDSVNIDHQGRTVALDFGSIKLGNTRFHFFGTPGQSRFHVFRDILALSASSAMLIFDSSTYLDHEDQTIMDEVGLLNIPFLAVLNIKTRLLEKTTREHVIKFCGSRPMLLGVEAGDVTKPGFVFQTLNRLLPGS